MTLALKISGVLALLVSVLLAGASRTAAAGPQAFLYEAVENLTQVLTPTTDRISHWAAQGTAVGGSPLCPNGLLDRLKLKPRPTSCTITAFGTDTIFKDLSGGTLHADFAAVINSDNIADAPEGVVMTGSIDGTLDLSFFFGVVPDLNAKKSLIGPSLPLIRVTGTFKNDDPSLGGTASFTATFRLPFRVTSAGKPDRPVRGEHAFYLGDDGSLIKVQPQEFAFSFPMLRADVTFR
jgi:hypothetical protein